MRYEIWDTKYEITPEGGQAAKAIAICLNGNKWRIMNDEIQIYEIIVKQKIDCEWKRFLLGAFAAYTQR